ncbi:membrane protein involved in aromatic hydrocarbon degradation/possibly transport [Sulfurimonas gotlandica GD1]|uniref:Membrane protein involved in aromatic hydrocarbon degradation/possibly transport n=1 Tax=Sulfurimonas gotlandica (strain DSM 19862 / JCM 16533 / GD1) TaxID=929558 RepID=B6BGV0_SULGG|nr:outer membrane protein transport protein [Sulfurimonas gotlandica]EDZ62996.1 membrane protein involved in aromatic hydrocarbon degradation [Sulfurimonas gotlandica GD1]EHP29734.1 membrane protein involved in aromatic hydrocarbon degradation/possibly transport [Sulfurimonas gotlandica GD1]
MKKTIKLALVAALALGATSAFATNGSNLIGVGAKARGMGGAGIGVAHGAESALANAALITSVENTEMSFGGTIFMPKVSFDNGGGAGSKDSKADMNVIPSVSIASKVNDNFYWGIGMWGTAGMGVDYRTEQANFKMVTNLQLMQFGVPLAYTMNNFSVALTPLLQYGALDIDYNTNGTTAGKFGTGVAQDLQFGYNLGLAYEIAGATIGATYKSQIDMNYNGVLSGAGTLFGLTLGDELSTPAEIGVGISYKMKEHTIAFDYKQIKWSDAKGYKDFKWDDQSVYVLGYEYATSGWAARAGYNYAKSPITDQGVANTAINTLNLLGFPGIVESHITIGGTFNASKTTSIDLAYVYSPEVSQTVTASNAPSPGTRETTVKHSQTALTVALNYAF